MLRYVSGLGYKIFIFPFVYGFGDLGKDSEIDIKAVHSLMVEETRVLWEKHWR